MTLQTRCLGLDPELVDYSEALELQRTLHAEVLAGRAPSTLLMLEHADVYTAGKRTEPADRPKDGTPVIDVDRGGKITWHGRGQLVGYPIIRLRDRAAVKDYVCAMEGALITVLAGDFGITGRRVEGRSGVWITDGATEKKIAAVGIRVHQSVTTHGFALNCSNDLSPFENIIACGIADAGTTTITAELGRTVTPTDVVERVTAQMKQSLLPFTSAAPQSALGEDVDVVSACNTSQPKEGIPS